MPYDPPGAYRRTDAERADQELSWRRPDRNFFAAGACHILAFEFLDRHPDAGYVAVGLRRPGKDYFDHVYAGDGEWAFDFCGWTLESELLAATIDFESAADPDVSFERVVIDVDLATFCSRYHHRPPEDFAHDPRPRAARFLRSSGHAG